MRTFVSFCQGASRQSGSGACRPRSPRWQNNPETLITGTNIQDIFADEDPSAIYGLEMATVSTVETLVLNRGDVIHKRVVAGLGNRLANNGIIVQLHQW